MQEKQDKSQEGAIAALRKALKEAQAVVIGAGAGLSISAGFSMSGPRFYEHFQDFADAYGFQDMYSGGFYPFDTLEEYWAYWSRYIELNRYSPARYPVYERLLELVQGKDYFVITTNVDHQFQRAGFDHHRLFYMQGDYGLWQCSVSCHQKTYDNEALVHEMVRSQTNLRIPSRLIPRCPRCGKPMSMNRRIDATFVEDPGWHAAARRYGDFLRRHAHKKILFLELGVGLNTPGIIKYPFWQRTTQNPQAMYACLNLGEVYAPEEIAERSICLSVNIRDFYLTSSDLKF